MTPRRSTYDPRKTLDKIARDARRSVLLEDAPRKPKERDNEEAKLQAHVLRELGHERDLLLIVNKVRIAPVLVRGRGVVPIEYGLGIGSPDLVGILTRRMMPANLEGYLEVEPVGQMFCLELKVPGEEPDPHQWKVIKAWRGFGAFVEVAHSVDEARAHLANARKGVRPWKP